MTGRLARSYPHCLLVAACGGLAAANALRFDAVVAGFAIALAGMVAAGRTTPIAVFGSLAVVLFSAGWWWGSERADALDSTTLGSYIERADESLVVVTSPAHQTSFEVRALGRVERFGALRLSEPVLLELPRGRAPPQGARLAVLAEVRKPRGPKNGFDERAWLRRQGIQVVLDGERWRIVGHRGGLGGVSDRLRRWLLRSSTPELRGERRAIVDGIVVGADEGLSQDLKDSFRASGLYHLLAVSGQNVAFLAVGVLALAWLLGIPRLAAEVCVLATIAAYTLAVGWQPSVVRAAVAGSLASLAWLTSRQRDRWYFMLVGAAVLLGWNPYSLRDPGFELSFAAVAAIFLLVPPLERWLEGYPVPKRLATAIAVSTACSAMTAPVLWLEFGSVPLYSVLANALAEPAVPPLLALGLLAAVISPVFPGAAAGLAWVNGWLAAYLAAVARVVAGLPYARVSSSSALAAAVLVCAGTWFALRRADTSSY